MLDFIQEIVVKLEQSLSKKKFFYFPLQLLRCIVPSHEQTNGYCS
jgi:hypothetical protein